MKEIKGYKTKNDKQIAQNDDARHRQEDIMILKMIRSGQLGPMTPKLKESEQTILGRLKKA